MTQQVRNYGDGASFSELTRSKIMFIDDLENDNFANSMCWCPNYRGKLCLDEVIYSIFEMT